MSNKKYDKYMKLLEDIKIAADMKPLNISGCEMCFLIIQNKILEAKKIKAGLEK